MLIFKSLMVLGEPQLMKLTRSLLVSKNSYLLFVVFLIVGLDPFAGVDLSTVSSDTLVNITMVQHAALSSSLYLQDAINTMREAAESAETDDFDPQIDAATGAAGTLSLLMVEYFVFLLATACS